MMARIKVREGAMHQAVLQAFDDHVPINLAGLLGKQFLLRERLAQLEWRTVTAWAISPPQSFSEWRERCVF